LCRSTASRNTRPSRTPVTKKKDVVWFAVNEYPRLTCFAGIWTEFKVAVQHLLDYGHASRLRLNRTAVRWLDQLIVRSVLEHHCLLARFFIVVQPAGM
jgi:hypothetical protein